MFRGCTPSPDLKIILETTILSISRGLPRLREIKKEKDDIAANRWREPLSCRISTTQQEKKDAGGYPTSYALRHTRYKYK